MFTLKGRIRHVDESYSFALGPHSLNQVFRAFGFKTNYYNGSDFYEKKNLIVHFEEDIQVEFEQQSRWMAITANSADEKALHKVCKWLANFLIEERFSFVLRCYREENSVYLAFMWDWNPTYEQVNQYPWDKA